MNESSLSVPVRRQPDLTYFIRIAGSGSPSIFKHMIKFYDICSITSLESEAVTCVMMLGVSFLSIYILSCTRAGYMNYKTWILIGTGVLFAQDYNQTDCNHWEHLSTGSFLNPPVNSF
jgi:hypothetical protein